MPRLLLGLTGIVLIGTGVAELVELSTRGLRWGAVLWAGLALASGAALALSAWRRTPGGQPSSSSGVRPKGDQPSA
jgi:hypothetical protein